MGLVTFNGTILMGGGGLAGSKNCCCKAKDCYCFTRTSMYVVVQRWRACYLHPQWDSANGVWVYPDGMPCDGGANGQICPPGSVGRSVTMEGIVVKFCGCGTMGEGYNASIITSQAGWDSCTPFSPPP